MDNNSKNKKNVLIYWKEDKIFHSGGPYGYLVPFLRKDSFEKISIQFLNNTNTINRYPKPKKFIIRFWKNLNIFRECFNAPTQLIDNINKYDAIVFHDTISLFNARKMLIDYKGTIFLQTHSPKPRYKEIIDSSQRKTKVLYYFFSKKIEKIDRYSFEKADFIIFPCKEAEEPYYQWRYYKNHRDFWNDKYLYLLTSLDDNKKVTCSTTNIRNRLQINTKTMILFFAGRHNKVKGYGLLKKLGRHYKNNKRIFFIVCGKYQNRKTLHQDNWKELGYQNDIFSLIKDADYCLNLNKQTYFDLGTLEYLSMGKNVIISRTGGNKKIIELFDKLVIPYSTKKELYSIIDNVVLNERKINEDEIFCRYTNIFNTEVFLSKFEHIILLAINKHNH